MKKFTSLLIGCSLALTGVAMAQQPDEQPSPKNKKQAPERTHGAEAKPGAKAAKPEAPTVKERGARHERGATNEQQGERKGRKAQQESATGAEKEANVSGEEAAGARQQAEQRRKGMKERGEAAAEAPASAAPPAAAASEQKGQANVAAAAKKKPDPQKVQQIKTQHANFRAQAKPQQVPTVTFNQNYRIQGSDRWQGRQYEVFRVYRPARHDRAWYHSNFARVELIGGGYYYFNSGYWYPAWGYSPSEEYYAYDAPIYVGHRAEPPDRVIADVQAVLQEMGYYKGEVDGLLGPLTREALASYQADQGLTATAMIDEPTLESLGMA